MRGETSRVVLVVDEDPSVRSLLSEALTTRGYEVRQAVDGTTASTVLGSMQRAPDLLIGDIMMPTSSGLSLARLVRRWQGDQRPVPIIFLTARAHAESIIHALNVGVRHYIQKPFSLQDLIRKVDRLLR